MFLYRSISRTLFPVVKKEKKQDDVSERINLIIMQTKLPECNDV